MLLFTYMPRRAVRRRGPNQATCKHTFHQISRVDPNGPGATRQPIGIRLGCSKCALVRTVYDNGIMVDGPVRPPTDTATWGHELLSEAPRAAVGTIHRGDMVAEVPNGPMTPAQRLDQGNNMMGVNDAMGRLVDMGVDNGTTHMTMADEPMRTGYAAIVDRDTPPNAPANPGERATNRP